MCEKRRIPDGTPVTWTSQAGGHIKEKSGIVLGFVPRWESPQNVLRRPLRSWERCDRFQCGSQYDCYIVAVNRGKNSHLADLYVPPAGVLERQNPLALTTLLPVGGTFVLTVQGRTTEAIAYNASPVVIQAAIDRALVNDLVFMESREATASS